MASTNRLKVKRTDTADSLVTKLSQLGPKDLWELPPDPGLDARLSRDLAILVSVARSNAAGGHHRDDPVRIVARRTTSIEGSRIAIPTRESLIVLNQGFILFVYNFMRIVSAHLSFADDPDPASHTAPSPREAARRVAELLDWSSSPLELPRIRTFPITSTQVAKASEFASVAEMFLVAHEFAHVLLGHEGSGTDWVRVGNKEVLGLTSSQAQEFEADTLAAVLIIAALRERGRDIHPQNYAAIELLFHGINHLERFGGQPPSATHPSADARRRVLRNGLSTLLPAAHVALIQNALAVEQMLRAWDPLIVEEARGRKATVDARIGALLGGTSGARQREELNSLLDEYPTATIARLRHELEQWNPGEVPRDDAAQRLYAARSMIFLYVKLGTHPAVRLALVPTQSAFVSSAHTSVAASLLGVS